MHLTDEEKAMFEGKQGEAKKVAMEILTDVGRAMGAESFVKVVSVQAMAHFGSLHIAGRDWLEKLACMGGKCCVPTTQDPASIPFSCWKEMGYDEEYAKNQYRLAEAVIKMGEMPMENKDIDEIFAFHNQVGEPLGKILVSKDSANCASKGMSIFMKGEPTHASLPEKGKNPVFALTRVVDAISEFTEPSQYKGLVLCTVVQLNVGDYAFGTAACDGVLRITIRAEFEDEMNLLQQKIERFAKKEADKEELELHFKFEDEFPETRNTKDSVAKIYRAAGKLNYEVGEKPMSRGSEDFGHYTKIVPGAIFYIGAGEDVPSFHTSEYDFTDSIMENAVEMFKALIEE